MGVHIIEISGSPTTVSIVDGVPSLSSPANPLIAKAADQADPEEKRRLAERAVDKPSPFGKACRLLIADGLQQEGLRDIDAERFKRRVIYRGQLSRRQTQVSAVAERVHCKNMPVDCLVSVDFARSARSE